MNKTLTKYLLAALSGVLIFVSFPDYDFFFLEWVSFVPLFIALQNSGYRQSYFLAVTTGVVTIIGGYDWLSYLALHYVGWPWPTNYLAPLIYGVYIGQLFGVIVLCFQWGRKKNIVPEVLLFPAILVSLWSLFPMLFPFKLGDGQSLFLQALQAIEITGVYGLDFLIAYSNILIFTLFSEKFWKKDLKKSALLLTPILLWFLYGEVRLNYWDTVVREASDTKKIGIIQPNHRAALSWRKGDNPYTRENPLELVMSKKIITEKPDVIIWPEGEFFGYQHWGEVRKAFNTTIGQFQIPLLFGDGTFSFKKGTKATHNSMVWINKEGKFGGTYSKRVLVPFGEYLPILDQFPELKRKLPFRFYSLTPGEKTVVFPIAGMNIVPVICYEVCFPEFVGKSITAQGKGKVLVNITQDGWYGPGKEPEQHLAISSLRAVENRTPLIRVVNNGISAIILPSGRSLFKSPTYEQGQWVISMPYTPEKGGSFFSHYPNLFLNIIRLLSIGFFGLLVRSVYLDKKDEKQEK